MAQPSVAREPSMEEILASIRRIIESNDPATDAGGAASAPSVYAEDDIDDLQEVNFTPERAANDPGVPFHQEHQPAPVAQAERSLSLADVAARVRAASARHQEMAAQRPLPREEALDEESVAPMAELRQLASSSAPEMSAEPAVQEAAAPVAPLVMPELRPALAEPSRPSAARETAVEEGEVPPVPAAAEPVHAQIPEASQLPMQMGGLAGLLSETAGAQVARSFSELANVFDGLERQSVEEMAQDMLRPMLQEWLDDNLPTLVERLVREEIERVARGPRR